MLLDRKLNDQFGSEVTHVKYTAQALDCSGASVMIIHNDKVVPRNIGESIQRILMQDPFK
ncbi:hypothetical protein AM1BK_50480 [Neobacillus kokaensis]|uniref:Uncharacterized protein n=2 Tax=Neobacillus kokaensis TaxID=2759023 RepID=A0ABQ3NC68_9BACI|nr:hypothetical protein AM1BK_50480 [Neobacillus kokaensis]